MIDSQKSHFLGNFLYVFGSQVLVLVAGLVKALIIPVVLSLSDYGYWQIYVFYSVYVGLFTLGYNDGIYLRFGGFRFEDLPLRTFRTANIFYCFTLLLGAAALVIFATSNVDPQREIIFYAVALNVVVLGVTANIALTLQATNRLKSYAIISSADKIFFTLALVALLNPNFQSFFYLILIDLISKTSVMAILVYRYRQLFIGSIKNMSDGIKELIDNIGAGGQLLIANLSGMLVLGIGRIVVEFFDEVQTYAHYAFALSLANVVLISVSALSIVLYPTLRRLPQENFLGYFNKTSGAFLAFSCLMLSGYFPALLFIQEFAKNYTPVIDFLNVMFVVTVLQGKMQLVNNTYYKALRLERQMLVANLSSLLIATGLATAGYLLTQSIVAIAYATLATMVFRVYASEIFLRRHMGERFVLRKYAEVLLFSGFIVITLITTNLMAFILWIVVIGIFIAVKSRSIIEATHQVRGRIR